jgi:acyl-coenzyme A synthetase/AMP-(fatty) acid ligase
MRVVTYSRFSSENQSQSSLADQVEVCRRYPFRIADLLQSHPEVKAASVRLMTPTEGQRLKAFIVPQDPATDPEPLRRRLIDWLTERVSAVEVPKAITFGNALPMTGMGKVQDWLPIP